MDWRRRRRDRNRPSRTRGWPSSHESRLSGSRASSARGVRVAGGEVGLSARASSPVPAITRAGPMVRLPVVNPDFQEAGLLGWHAELPQSAAAPCPVGSTFCGEENIVGNAAGAPWADATGAVRRGTTIRRGGVPAGLAPPEAVKHRRIVLKPRTGWPETRAGGWV